MGYSGAVDYEKKNGYDSSWLADHMFLWKAVKYMNNARGINHYVIRLEYGCHCCCHLIILWTVHQNCRDRLYDIIHERNGWD